MKKMATLRRTEIPDHTCPSDFTTLDFLMRGGFKAENRHMTVREATDAFWAEHCVKTAAQTFADGVRIEGYDDLRRHFGFKVRAWRRKPRAVIAVFATAALLVMVAWMALQHW
ncbi:MAG: hypothetical protein ACRC7G_09185 [Beijerinckiaceae bacterium]